MCGGGNINFPDPNEVGRAQFAWNNLNQYTPYGNVEYAPPELDANGNPISAGSMTQTLDPNLLALQESMLGIRGSALGAIGDLFGNGGFDLSNPQGPGAWARWGTPGAGGGGGGWGSNTGNEFPADQKIGTVRGGGSGGGSLPAPRQPGGRVTPDPRNPNPYGHYGNSMISGAGEGLNPLFYSERAPGLQYALNMNSLPDLLGAGDLTGERDRITQTKFDRLKGLLDPVFAEKRTALEQQMANRGMPVGAEEYNILNDQLGQQESNAYLNAAQEADLAGLQELQGLAGLSGQQRGQLFGEMGTQLGLSNQARQQAFGEQMGVNDFLLRSMLGQGSFGLQENAQKFGQLASLLGLTQPPGAGGDLSQFYGPSPVDMMGAYGMNMGGQQFNAGNQITGAGLMSGLFGLGGAALGSGMFG